MEIAPLNTINTRPMHRVLVMHSFILNTSNNQNHKRLALARKAWS
jgi:hypothetical protein